MEKNFSTIGSRIYFTDSARELGFARFVLGGVILFFGLFFIWIEIYLVGIPISLFGIILMEHCSEIIIDTENKLLIKKTGWIKPFITLNMKSIAEATALSIETVSTSRRTAGQIGRRTTISYKLNFEMPDKKMHINTFSEKTKANAYANEISKLLEIEFKKSKSKNVESDLKK